MINNLVLESSFLTLQKQWSTSRVLAIVIFVLTSLIYCQTLEHLTENETYENPVSCHHLTQMLHCLASKHAAVT